MTTKRRQRHLGGVTFNCHAQGSWLSLDGRLAICCMMAGRVQQQWELYRTEPCTRIPKQPFNNDTFDWDWENLSYAITMSELGKEIVTLREESRVLLPLLIPDKTMVQRGRHIRLVREVVPDGDGVGAIMRVQGADSMDRVEQWSTYRCLIYPGLPGLEPSWKGEA